MKRWLWNGIDLTLPDDWEMLQFSRNPVQGRCAFADRYQFRFELDWLRVSAPPDLERMSSDYFAKLAEDGLEDIVKAAHLSWVGATGMEKLGPVSRYGNYFPGKSLLLECVFLWDKEERPKPAFEARILDSISVPAPALDGTRQWRAFGMDWTAGAGYEFDNCQVCPGLAEATFLDKSGRASQVFSRRGMLPQWFKTTPEDWLKQNVPREYTVTETVASSRNGHETWTVRARRKRPVLMDWLHGRRTYQAAAWICPEDHRLYCVSSVAHGSPALPRLACCNLMEATP